MVLSEICAYNITFYSNILPGYQMLYWLPLNSKVGGDGISIKNCYDVQEVPYSLTLRQLILIEWKLCGCKSLI